MPALFCLISLIAGTWSPFDAEIDAASNTRRRKKFCSKQLHSALLHVSLLLLLYDIWSHCKQFVHRPKWCIKPFCSVCNGFWVIQKSQTKRCKMRQYPFCNKKIINFGSKLDAEISIWIQYRFDGLDLSATLLRGSHCPWALWWLLQVTWRINCQGYAVLCSNCKSYNVTNSQCNLNARQIQPIL